MIKRLSQFIKNKHLSVRAFEATINASDGMIRRAITNNTDIQAKWLIAIAENYPEINLSWLLTGKGEMLCESSSVSKDSTSEVESLKQDIERLKHQVDRLIETNLLLIKNHPATLSAARRVAR